MMDYTGPWEKDEIQHLKKTYPHSSTYDVAFDLDRPVEAVKKRASRLGLRKTKKYLKTLGRKS